MQDGAGGSALKLSSPLLLFPSNPLPPKCTQACLHLGLRYMCVSVTASAVLARDYRGEEGSRAFGHPMCGHKCGKRELLVSVQRDCC